jgi:alkanesulfonate monooxygenase SsuD/methylene tetrahydromethanopterin reductase-like flavin-dependent oxidoreductase (luciferase family)
MKISLMSLGDHTTDPVTGTRTSPGERHRMMVDAAVAAEEGGFHGMYIGEHHGLEYIFSSPPVLLAAIAERTTRLRLSTAVTLLANLDAFRAAEDYATLDVLSGGRAEIVAGRGNFFASTYTLFGQSVDESRERFDENAELLLELWRGEPVHWEGKFRPPVNGERLQPTPAQRDHPPVWIAGGASKETADLAARNGLGLMLPSAFGRPDVFRAVADQYLEEFTQAEGGPGPQLGACWHVNVARTSQEARARWEPRYRRYFEFMRDVLVEVNPQMPLDMFKKFDFDWLSTEGPAICGSPAEVVDRLAKLADLVEAESQLLYLDMGGMPPAEYVAMVELLGQEVLPAFR